MSYLAIKGNEWAQVINPATAPALFPSMDALPNGAAVFNYNEENGDIIIMAKHVEAALSRVLNVAENMRDANSIAAWSYTPEALAAVLSDLRAVWDASSNDFKLQYSDAGVITPMSLHDFSDFMMNLVKHNDTIYPAAPFFGRPANIHGANAFAMPANPADGVARWEVSWPASANAEARWGTAEWIRRFMDSLTLTTLYDVAVSDDLARRLNQFIKATMPAADRGHPPIVAIKSTWTRLLKMAAGTLLNTWAEAISLDPESMALDFLNACADTLKAIPSEWTPPLITHSDAQTLMKAAHDATGTQTTASVISVFSYCLPALVRSHPAAHKLIYDLRDNALKAWETVCELAFLTGRDPPKSMLETNFILTSAAQKYATECMSQASSTPLDIRVAVLARLRAPSATAFAGGDGSSTPGSSAAASAGTTTSNIVAVFESSTVLQQLAQGHMGANKLLNCEPSTAYDYMALQQNTAAVLNLLRVLLSTPTKQFAGRVSIVSIFITELKPTAWPWVTKRLARPSAISFTDAPPAPWNIGTDNSASLSHHISLKVQKQILAGDLPKIDFLDLASDIKAFGMNTSHRQVMLDPSIKRPMFSLQNHVALVVGAAAAVVAAIGFKDGPFGLAYFYKLANIWMNELPRVRPAPEVIKQFWQAVTESMANDIFVATSRAKMGALVATPSCGNNAGTLPDLANEINKKLEITKTVAPFIEALTTSSQYKGPTDESILGDGTSIVAYSANAPARKSAAEAKRPSSDTDHTSSKRAKQRDTRKQTNGSEGASVTSGQSSSYQSNSNPSANYGRPLDLTNVSQADIDQQNTFFRENVKNVNVNNKFCISISGKPGYYDVERLQQIKAKYKCATYVYPVVRDRDDWKNFIHPGSRTDTSRQPKLSEEMKRDVQKAWIKSEGAVITSNNYGTKNS